jgi:hypothetical protein
MDQTAISSVQESRRVVESRSDHHGVEKRHGERLGGRQKGVFSYVPGAKMEIPA